MMNLTGQRYGRLTVVSRAPNQGEKVCWRCACDCGNETNVQTYNLVFGLTKSCGCYRKERSSEVHGKQPDMDGDQQQEGSPPQRNEVTVDYDKRMDVVNI